MFLGIHTKTRRDMLRKALTSYAEFYRRNARADNAGDMAELAVIDAMLREINAADQLTPIGEANARSE